MEKIKAIFNKRPSARDYFAPILDTLLPPQSLLTGARGVRNAEADMWAQVTFIDAPCCDRCGFPFEYDVGPDVSCAGCAAYPPRFDRLRSAFQYDDFSRRLILEFKHGGRTLGVPVFTGHLSRIGRQFLQDADVIMPVPLHPTRLIKRRFNQSAILARALSKRSGVRYDPDSLYRKRRTDTQGGKTAAGRRRNVSGAFDVRASAGERVNGAHVILIDDVYTTGATINACTRALKAAGARQVDALTLARVVRGAALPT